MSIEALGKAMNECLGKSLHRLKEYRPATINSFPTKIINVNDYPKDITYLDQRTKGEQLVSGQELVEVGGKKFARNYYGGFSPKEDLQRLGVNQEQILEYLIEIIDQMPSTRLDTNCSSKREDGFEYTYKVLVDDDLVKRIPLTISQEIIKYKGRIVYSMGFSMGPLK